MAGFVIPETLNDLESSLADWHVEKFGRRNSFIPLAIRELHRTLGEFVKVVIDRDLQAIPFEAASVLFELLHIVRTFGFRLKPATDAKLEEIWRRLENEKRQVGG